MEQRAAAMKAAEAAKTKPNQVGPGMDGAGGAGMMDRVKHMMPNKMKEVMMGWKPEDEMDQQQANQMESGVRQRTTQPMMNVTGQSQMMNNNYVQRPMNGGYVMANTGFPQMIDPSALQQTMPPIQNQVISTEQSGRAIPMFFPVLPYTISNNAPVSVPSAAIGTHSKVQLVKVSNASTSPMPSPPTQQIERHNEPKREHFYPVLSPDEVQLRQSRAQRSRTTTIRKQEPTVPVDEPYFTSPSPPQQSPSPPPQKAPSPPKQKTPPPPSKQSPSPPPQQSKKPTPHPEPPGYADRIDEELARSYGIVKRENITQPKEADSKENQKVVIGEKTSPLGTPESETSLPPLDTRIH